jgi:transposase
MSHPESAAAGPVEVAQQRQRELVDQWRDSGLSQSEFCRRHGLGTSSFSRWKSRLLAEELSSAGSVRMAGGAPEGFVAVRLLTGALQPLGPGFEVTLRCGRKVRLEPGFDGEGLKRLLVVLEGAAC